MNNQFERKTREEVSAMCNGEYFDIQNNADPDLINFIEKYKESLLSGNLYKDEDGWVCWADTIEIMREYDEDFKPDDIFMDFAKLAEGADILEIKRTEDSEYFFAWWD